MRYLYIFLLFISFNFLNAEWIAWDTSEGLHRLHNSEAKQNFWKLMRYYESQSRKTYCSVASSVIALNALEVNCCESKLFGNYRIFTQEEFFSETVKDVIDPKAVEERGMCLDELAHVLETFPLKVSKHAAADLTHGEMRQLLITALQNPDQCVLVLYQRKELPQEGGGHWSPLAAYDASSDSFLVLDVARYKYPPVWIKAPVLLNAMQMQNDEGRSRGFLILEKLLF